MTLLKKRLPCLITAVFVISFFLTLSACTDASHYDKRETITIVSTTTMLTDLAKQIGGDKVTVFGLMGSGVDPHQYRASAGDITKMNSADMVIYSGLHLEGKMGDVISAQEGSGKKVICAADGITEDSLIKNNDIPDPHIWFDVSLWKEAAKTVEKGLEELDTENKDYYAERLESYIEELAELDSYVREKSAEVPEDKRVLITAHDAFGYFGRAYGFEVKGLQGISTVSEAGTADVSRLADFIAENRIKAVFVESSLPVKNIEALIEAVKARNFETNLGGFLYSDSIGDEKNGTDTYISAFKHNIDTIAEELK